MINFQNSKNNIVEPGFNLSNQREKYLLSLRRFKILEKYLSKFNECSNHNQLKNLGITNKKTISEIKSIDDIITLFNQFNLDDKEFKDIYYIIFILKFSVKFLSEKLISKLNLQNFFSSLLSQYSYDSILINQVLKIILFLVKNINFIHLFSDESFIQIYINLIKNHISKEEILVILLHLLQKIILGNNGNKIRIYQNDIINLFQIILKIENISSNIIKEIIKFFYIYLKEIKNDYYFQNKNNIIECLICIFSENIIFNNCFKYCISGINLICLLGNENYVIKILKKKPFFDYILSNSFLYLKEISNFICNISSINGDINLKVLQEYDIFNFFLQGLSSESRYVMKMTLIALNNFLNEHNNEIKHILFEKGIIQKIIDLLDSKDIIYENLVCVQSLIIYSNYEIMYYIDKINIFKNFIKIILNYDDVCLIESLVTSIYFILVSNKKRNYKNYSELNYIMILLKHKRNLNRKISVIIEGINLQLKG